jgi:hypothetical protein
MGHGRIPKSAYAAVMLVYVGTAFAPRGGASTSSPKTTEAVPPTTAVATTTVPTPTTQPAPTTAPAPVYTAGATCQNGQMGVTTSAVGEGLGHASLISLFTNTSQTACTLYGYPGVAALNDQGAQVKQAQRTLTGFVGGLANQSNRREGDSDCLSGSVSFRHRGRAGRTGRNRYILSLLPCVPGDSSGLDSFIRCHNPPYGYKGAVGGWFCQ